MKQIFKIGTVIAGQILLLLLFSAGISPLVVQDGIDWLAVAYAGIVGVTGLILVGWLIPTIRRQRWFWLTNLIWVGGWMLYLLVLFSIVIIAINRLASLG